ncbi:MAG: SocA family protein [Paludibacteraceae bacterium]|nr:SocA family protein [Paludibacteraceae bacterium]
MDIRTLKILNSILYFASKENDKTISRLKLMKLLWLADRLHLNKYGRLILKDNYFALPHGPIPSNALNFSNASIPGFYTVNGNKITAIKKVDDKFFSGSDLEIMEFVWQSFGNMTASSLRNLSHKFPEWIRFQKELEDTSLPNKFDIVMDDFFEAPLMKNFKNIASSEESSESKTFYRSFSAIQSFLDK